MKNPISTILLLFATSTALPAATSMVGDVGMRHARIWVNDAQQSSSATFSATCTADGKTVNALPLMISTATNTPTAILDFSDLKPNTKYTYSVKANDGKTEIASGQFKTKPDFLDRTPPPDFSFALFGENYLNDKQYDPPFKTPGGEYEIYEAVRAKNPDFCIWAEGMNTLRNADEDSMSAKTLRGIAARDIPEIKKLISERPNYSVAAESSFFGRGNDSNIASLDDASAAFDNLWANPRGKFGKSYSFKYSDTEFFVLDDCSARSYFTDANSRPARLGDKQLDWLMAALQNSKANFKIVVMNSPFGNPSASRENLAYTQNERQKLLDFLVFSKIKGVVFLSANKPFGELTRLVRAGGYPIYDMTAAPLTGRPAKEIKEMNYFRVPNSSITRRAFSIVKIDGPENDRAITFSFFDSKGKQLHSTTVKLSDLGKFE